MSVHQNGQPDAVDEDESPVALRSELDRIFRAPINAKTFKDDWAILSKPIEDPYSFPQRYVMRAVHICLTIVHESMCASGSSWNGEEFVKMNVFSSASQLFMLLVNSVIFDSGIDPKHQTLLTDTIDLCTQFCARSVPAITALEVFQLLANFQTFWERGSYSLPKEIWKFYLWHLSTTLAHLSHPECQEGFTVGLNLGWVVDEVLLRFLPNQGGENAVREALWVAVHLLENNVDSRWENTLFKPILNTFKQDLGGDSDEAKGLAFEAINIIIERQNTEALIGELVQNGFLDLISHALDQPELVPRALGFLLHISIAPEHILAKIELAAKLIEMVHFKEDLMDAGDYSQACWTVGDMLHVAPEPKSIMELPHFINVYCKLLGSEPDLFELSAANLSTVIEYGFQLGASQNMAADDSANLEDAPNPFYDLIHARFQEEVAKHPETPLAQELAPLFEAGPALWLQEITRTMVEEYEEFPEDE